jgi:hypothetical protein
MRFTVGVSTQESARVCGSTDVLSRWYLFILEKGKYSGNKGVSALKKCVLFVTSKFMPGIIRVSRDIQEGMV